MVKVADQTNRNTASQKEEGKGRKSVQIIPKTVLRAHKCTPLLGGGEKAVKNRAVSLRMSHFLFDISSFASGQITKLLFLFR